MTIPRFLQRPSRPILPLVLLAVFAVSTSCGRGGKGLSPVRGQVFYEGQPANGAVVFFHPEGDSSPSAARPIGKVGADGWFELTTDTRGKGAPPGRYTVSVVWKSPSPAGDGDEKNLAPPRYMNPATSQLTAEVKEGANELPPFRLTR